MNEQRKAELIGAAMACLMDARELTMECATKLMQVMDAVNSDGMRTCEQCGDGIGDHRRTCRFCSDRCRKRWHRAQERAAVQPALPVEVP